MKKAIITILIMAFFNLMCKPAVKMQHFKDNGNGTITDVITGLMWESKPSIKKMNWYEAMDYAKNFRLAGYSDWRLPTEPEYHKLIEHSDRTNKAVWLNVNGFRNVLPHRYWSSTTLGGYQDTAWYLDMSCGFILHDKKKIKNKTYAICVRSVNR